MKVGEIGGTHAVQKNSDASKESGGARADEFRTLLEEELNPRVDSAHSPTGMFEAHGLMQAGIAVPNLWDNRLLSGDIHQVMDAVQAAGVSLDRVDQLISEGKSNLRGMDEAIRTLSLEADKLQQKLSLLPNDHPLRKVGDEMSVLAYVESVKWRRGDHL